MKKILKDLILVLLIVSVFTATNGYCYASEKQYTDNVIPAMTSNSSPSGVVSASSIYTFNGTYPAYLAFDHDSTTRLNGWVTGVDNKKGWLCYEFNEKKCITKYTIVSRSAIGSIEQTTVVEELPTKWTFEAWNGENWIILDEKIVTDWKHGVKKEFTIENHNKYIKYRINITENNGMNYTSIGELEMMETASNTDNKLKVVMEVEEKIQLSVMDDLNVNSNMTWTSSDESVATVDENGIVTAKKKGDAMITVINKDGIFKDKIHILVVDDASELRLAIDMKTGTKRRVTIDDLMDTKAVSWNSMDSEIATIDAKGKITAIKKGLVLITATDENGDVLGTIYVRVRE